MTRSSSAISRLLTRIAAPGLGLALLLALACLSLGFLLSALSKRTATALGIALFIWLALVFFADLGLMGTAIVLDMNASTLLGLALANPLQTFKIASVLNLQSNLELLGPAGLYATRTFGGYLMALLVALLGLWIAGPLSLTYLVFRKRGGF